MRFPRTALLATAFVASMIGFGQTAQAENRLKPDFYVGAFGTGTYLDSTVIRPSGRDTWKAVDQGGDGFGVRLTAGAEWRLSERWRLGAEVDYLRQIDTASRLYPVRYEALLHSSYAAYARVGYEWPGRGVFFLRGGMAAVRIQGQETLTTPAFGGGVELALSQRWRLRADITHYLAAGRDKFESTTVGFGLVFGF